MEAKHKAHRLLLREMLALRGRGPIWLAKVCGVTYQAIYLIQSGRVNPRIDTLLRIADALECSVDSLIEREI